MSGTIAPTPTGPSAASGNSTRVSVATWAPLGVTVINLCIFGAVATFAYISHDATSIAIIVGASIGMAKDATGYWFSSNAGSRAKDDRQADMLDKQTTALAASAPLAAVVVPPAIAPVVAATVADTAATAANTAAVERNTQATAADTNATRPTA